MQVDNQLITYLEELSCLSLSDSERSRFTEDLQKIINSISGLSGLNTDGINEYSCPFDKTGVYRDDIVIPSLDRKLILKNASVKNDEFFIAPKTVE